MKIRYKPGTFAQPDARKDLAMFVAGTLEPMRAGWLPYKPNETDDRYWTVDHGNDWKVAFPRDDSGVLEIRHRYQNAAAETALAQWVAYRTGGAVLAETPEVACPGL